MAQSGESSNSSVDRVSRDSTSNSGAASFSTIREEDERNRVYDNDFRDSVIGQQHQQYTDSHFRGNWLSFDELNIIRDDTCSCLVIVLTFWFFVSMTMILGVFGAVSLSLGPDSSLLIQPNPIFVQSVKVEMLEGSNSGLILYGLYETPPLEAVKIWSRTLNVSVSSDSHKEWSYFLNEGSQVNISYNVKSASSSLFLVIAKGNEGLDKWLEDPTYPNTTLSWNVIQGTGTIQQKISESSSYYVAVGNLNSDDAEVQLQLRVRALQYNTSEAYYKCTFRDRSCSLRVLFPSGNDIVLVTPGPDQGSLEDDWYVKVSYGPRWAIYIVGIAGLTLLMLLILNCLNNYQHNHEESAGAQHRQFEPARAPLLTNKDDDISSLGSSYDSVSNDEEELEKFLAGGEGTSSKDGETDHYSRRLCCICFDAPRDCFFLPCGHCAACFECGKRIVEAAGICPICLRHMKKVRKIFAV